MFRKVYCDVCGNELPANNFETLEVPEHLKEEILDKPTYTITEELLATKSDIKELYDLCIKCHNLCMVEAVIKLKEVGGCP